MATGFVSGLSLRQALKLGAPQVFTCPSGVLVGHLVYLSGASTVALARADVASTMPVLGVVVAKPTSTSCVVSRQASIVLPYVATLTPGASVWLSAANAGEVSTTKPTGETQFVTFVGQALTATSVFFSVDPMNVPPDAPTAIDTEVFTPTNAQTTFTLLRTISRPEDTVFKIDGVSFVYGSGVGINDFHVVGNQVIWHDTAMVLDPTVTVSITYRFDVSA